MARAQVANDQPYLVSLNIYGSGVVDEMEFSSREEAERTLLHVATSTDGAVPNGSMLVLDEVLPSGFRRELIALLTTNGAWYDLGLEGLAAPAAKIMLGAAEQIASAILAAHKRPCRKQSHRRSLSFDDAVRSEANLLLRHAERNAKVPATVLYDRQAAQDRKRGVKPYTHVEFGKVIADEALPMDLRLWAPDTSGHAKLRLDVPSVDAEVLEALLDEACAK